MMAEDYNWKNLSFVVATGAATFGPIVPSMMHMEIKEISYSNLTNAQNRVILRQIPSGTVRPPHSVIIDQQSIAPLAPYSPRIPIRTVQEDHVIEASSDAGPCIVNLVYRLKYGRP
jgi:hypothetical protein